MLKFINTKSPSLIISVTAGVVILLLACFPDIFFPFLSLERTKLEQGEVWRLLTCNFVHFGWPHSLMNLAAFGIFSAAFASEFSGLRYVGLIFFCCLAVGLGVYTLNPEYEVYAGLSGAIHGLFVAGLLLNKRHVWWVNLLLVAALFGKIFMEHQPGYQATELQSLLPVAVAYDAHLYGALAGLVFGSGCLLLDFSRRQKINR